MQTVSNKIIIIVEYLFQLYTVHIIFTTKEFILAKPHIYYNLHVTQVYFFLIEKSQINALRNYYKL